MKTRIRLALIVSSLALIGIVFAADSDDRLSSYMRGLFKVRNAVELRSALSVQDHATQAPAAAKVSFGIQAGTNIISDDSTVTNTFSTAFTSAPFVTLTQFTAEAPTNIVLVSVSTTQFIAWGQTNSPFHWQAIGAP